MKRTASQRFWAKVNKTAEGGCWEWTAAKGSKDGYGLFKLSGRMVTAHRFAYAEVNGEIADGLVLDHICHNRACVNPDHLRAVTHKQNLENRSRKDRGAYWHAGINKWRARVCHNYRQIHLGYFDTKDEALAAARAKRLELYTHNDLDRTEEEKSVGQSA